jgi:flagellar basal body rod protein FlgG
MNKQEMLKYLQSGEYYVKHSSFSDDEFIYMEDGQIVDEEGYKLGDIYGEFFQIRSGEAWEDGWYIKRINNPIGAGSLILNNIVNDDVFHYHENEVLYDTFLKPNSRKSSSLKGTAKSFKGGIAKPVEPRSTVNRNDPCPCGSNMKYKRCCGKIKN